ncbi:uncharacterized protein F5147DRAFT_779461 [Suillus discolor]|uniref:C2H2-type domain-containing protein n=1 Tax=Suillus discolor TaxID=1912936 RepID=A0A9P7EWY0_9AGAM|nr:uncharacterized protein F5147DRAFT_779461 [Suillus discolor]KAG2093139.1 hypothetical protein F5147DRAFT_779461 [Suillus discolor]
MYASHLLAFLAGPDGIIRTRGQVLATRTLFGTDQIPAVDHILEIEGKPTPDSSAASPASASGSAGNPVDVDVDVDAGGPGAISNAKTRAKSNRGFEASIFSTLTYQGIKCSECGKVFKNTALADYHVEKSGHDPFEESGRAAKRSVKAQQEAVEARANEAIRFKSGKDELKAEELMKEEKLEDARAKATVDLARIEADKKVRAVRAAREKALRDVRSMIDSSDTASATPALTAPSSSGTSGKDFKDTHLQIRMASRGTPYTTTLPSDASMSHLLPAHTNVLRFPSMWKPSHSPRKTFSRDQFSKTFIELGLTPSAVRVWHYDTAHIGFQVLIAS